MERNGNASEDGDKIEPKYTQYRIVSANSQGFVLEPEENESDTTPEIDKYYSTNIILAS